MFVEEQGVPIELEIDELDATAQHFIAMQDENIVGTLRVFFEEEIAKLGRLVVAKSKRHQGIATALMQEATLFCFQQGITKIKLDAQIKAKAFYQNLGFSEEGSVFFDAGIPHIHMVKAIKGI